MVHNMKLSHLIIWGFATLIFSLQVKSEEIQTDSLVEALSQCRLESSQLIRLDCYDKIMTSTTSPDLLNPSQMGRVWRQAMENELQRKDNSAGFLVSLPEDGGLPVIMTIPALGMSPPRPVLMLSCIDNITRLQIAMPSKQEAGSVMLSTDKTQFTAEWFLRENGYVLESSRGLLGIDEIKRLLNAEKLTVKLANNERLSFNISGISQDIKPLRNACRW